jgi:hypothetical protein
VKAHDRVEYQPLGRARFFLAGVEVTEDQYREKYPLPTAGRFYFLGGAVFTEAEHLALTEPEEKGDAAGLVTFKPMTSNALRVRPCQVDEARDFAAKNGVPTDYRPDGSPVITSSRQFRRLARIQGFVHQGY